MILGGLQKLTLIDYPSKVAATVFTVGCNFRCPFCHNPELVLSSEKFERGSLSEEDFFQFLEKRKGKLDGVCVTGGEPTVQKDILSFLKKIKDLGFFVKLDSNGTNPKVLEEAFDKKLVDFIAMDVKSSLENYHKACGVNFDLDKIKASVKLIRSSGVAYEFRTTVVPGIHVKEDFESMGIWLDGIDDFALQEYRDEGKILNEKFLEKQDKIKLDLQEIKECLQTHFKNIVIR